MDLQDCHRSISSGEELEKGSEEFKAREILIELCRDIAEEFPEGDELPEGPEEDEE